MVEQLSALHQWVRIRVLLAHGKLCQSLDRLPPRTAKYPGLAPEVQKYTKACIEKDK